jgi:Protein of unknown function (DUF3086)
MNSEIPSIPESENSETTETTIFEADQSDQSSDALQLDVDEQIPEVIPEVTPDVIDDHDPGLVNQRSPITVEPESVADSLEELEELLEFELPTAAKIEQNSEDNHDLHVQPVKEAELFVDTWLDESEPLQENNPVTPVSDEVQQLKQLKNQLQQEIAELKAHKEQLLLHQVQQAQENLGRMIEEGTKELRERKTALRIEIEKLERRQERLNQEMRSNFAGSSKELAIRVQGFKEYLVGSLQDLASAADKLELVRTGEPAPRSRERIRDLEDPRREFREGREVRDRDRTRNRDRNPRSNEPARTGTRTGQGNRPAQAQFSEPTFADQSRRIRQLLDKYCNSPDYYGSPWQLRRTFDQSQAKKVQDWFFSQGGRGAIDSTGSRLQNILVASATVSILHDLYRDRTQVLVLTDTPENLGEWRKGLEDCLGISRQDFGTTRGVVLFDSPDILVQRAERLLADKLLPVIIIDETEEQLNLSVLKFPIWLAFASSNKSRSANYLY